MLHVKAIGRDLFTVEEHVGSIGRDLFTVEEHVVPPGSALHIITMSR